jgi:hypothetical protein
MDGSQAPAFPAGPNVAELIRKFILLRDKVAEVKEAQKKQLVPYTEMMDRLEGVLLAALNSAGVDSMKGMGGTVYKSTRVSASVKEWAETLAFIQKHELWDLLQARVSKDAALAVVEETGQPIPGVNISQETVLHVRRS